MGEWEIGKRKNINQRWEKKGGQVKQIMGNATVQWRPVSHDHEWWGSSELGVGSVIKAIKAQSIHTNLT